jgi:CheY-like chemotaxis protein
MSATVMVIDDDHAILDLMKLLLEKMGYVPALVDDGLRALDLVKQNPPDLILLDVMMTPINGWEFLSRLRNELGLRQIPVIFFTAFPFIEEKIDPSVDSRLSLLQKPVSYQELKQAIMNLLAT